MTAKCPICQSTKSSHLSTCRCGYNFIEDKISDKNITRAYYRNLKRTKHWIEPAIFTEKLHKYQQLKKGESRVGVRGGWGYSDTAKLIGSHKSMVSDDIKLVKNASSSPELLKCVSRGQALRLCKSLTFGILSHQFEKYDSEEKLHQYLEANWEMTPFGKEWELRESYAYAGDAGEIDLLAHHRREDCWLVVELKKDKSPDKTVGQILRYMGWLKENRAGKEDKVYGVIVHSYPPDKHLRYALLVTPNVSQKIYYCYKGETKFMESAEAYRLLKFEKLPIDKQKRLLNFEGN